MIKTRPSFFIGIFLFLLFWAWISIPYCPAQQVPENAVTTDSQEKAEPDKIVGTPQDAKQQMGIWVFVGWMWISVIVLIWVLRLKIKEVDRLYGLRFFSAKKD